MRLSLSLSLLAPALACLAAADSGSLYIYDSQRPSAPASAAATTVSADIARLIIASHLRLDHLHDLGSLDEESIQTINHLSAAHSVFAQSPDTAVALILGQGLDNKGMPEQTTVVPCALYADSIPKLSSPARPLIMCRLSKSQTCPLSHPPRCSLPTSPHNLASNLPLLP